MRNIFLITKREYLTQVKKKSFIILTLLAPILIVAFGVLIGVLMKANSSQTTLQVIDKSGLYIDKLSSDEQVQYQKITPAQEKAYKDSLKHSETVDGMLIIAPIVGNDFNAHQQNTTLLISDKVGFETKRKITHDLSAILRQIKASSMHLNEEQLDALNRDFELKSTHIDSQNNTDTDLDFGVKYGLGMVLMYVTFMFILMYGVRVMRSVLEEKNNRVVEIIISSVKPFELMIGKILGVTLVAFTQFSVWITMTIAGAIFLNTGFAAMQQQFPSEQAQEMDVQAIATQVSHTLLTLNTPLIIFVFLFFFLFGYIFYSSMYAAIGSAVDNETETQQFSLFAIIPLMVGMYGSFSIVNNPDGPMGVWLSLIPFTSPVAMIARIPFGVPVWQIALSMGLLVMSALCMVWLASKIYRIGILMHGNKVTLKELWKWLKY